MAKFNITVTDLETGDVVLQENTNVIVGAILGKDQVSTRTIMYAKSNALDIAHVIIGAENVCEKYCLEDMDIGLAYLKLKDA